MTDEAAFYTLIGGEFAAHGVVRHQIGEYVNKEDGGKHINTIEGFFGCSSAG